MAETCNKYQSWRAKEWKNPQGMIGDNGPDAVMLQVKALLQVCRIPNVAPLGFPKVCWHGAIEDGRRELVGTIGCRCSPAHILIILCAWSRTVDLEVASLRGCQMKIIKNVESLRCPSPLVSIIDHQTGDYVRLRTQTQTNRLSYEFMTRRPGDQDDDQWRRKEWSAGCMGHGPWAMGQMGMGSNVIGTTAVGAISYSNSIWWRSLAEEIGSLQSGDISNHPHWKTLIAHARLASMVRWSLPLKLLEEQM